MVSSIIKRAFLASAIAFVLPAAATAQAPGAGHDHAAGSAHAHEGIDREEVGVWMTELQQVHEQLEGLQQQALQDPAINAAQEELGEEIRVAMAEADPTLDEQLARMATLESEATTAQQTGDVQTLQTLMGEAQQIQQRFISVQQQVLGQPQIAGKVANFQTQLESKMLELDPEAEALITRFRELETKLNEAMGAGA